MGEGTERTVVKTYVPRHQKEIWREEAEAMDMSQSEFVRSMVQAGRRGFDLGAGGSDDPVETGDPDATPRGSDLEARVIEVLRDGGHLDWEELLDRVTDDVEERLDGALGELQSDNRIRYSGRHGGYTLVDDG